MPVPRAVTSANLVVQRMALVGVIRVKHPFAAVAAERRRDGIRIDDCRTEYVALERGDASMSPDEQVDGEPAQRAPVFGSRPPWIAGAALHDSLGVKRDPRMYAARRPGSTRRTPCVV